jgi:hypothetical protein
MEDDVDNWQQEPGFYNSSPEPSLDPIQWTASEFVSHQKTGMWYVSLGGISAVITIIVFIVTHNILSALVVAAACMAFGVLAARKPETKSYQISSDGVTIAGRVYPFNMFKAFSVIEEGAINCIWLRPLKKFAPTVAMYYPPDQEDRIIMMLDNFLPQEDRQHDIVERLSRRIRF